ncbi:hypothetical protein V6N13_034042 [Hibiscus sabdariffa]|uniref:Uncharacterized protein n=1 Tax=Hibiscus sabdariffa TaxID=183260 RepID=A0ABR2F8P1_9ROSI
MEVGSQGAKRLPIKLLVMRSKVARYWRMLCRKLMRQNNMFNCSSRAGVSVSYDPHTYAQNFDQGLMSADDLARSFSARFALPSRLAVSVSEN